MPSAPAMKERVAGLKYRAPRTVQSFEPFLRAIEQVELGNLYLKTSKLPTTAAQTYHRNFGQLEPDNVSNQHSRTSNLEPASWRIGQLSFGNVSERPAVSKQPPRTYHFRSTTQKITQPELSNVSLIQTLSKSKQLELGSALNRAM